MKVTYYGQACTLVEAAGRKILTDPWLTEGAYQGTWFHTHLLADAGISPQSAAAERPDYLFLSHEHHDHTDPASLKAFPHDIPILVCRFPSDRFLRYLQGFGLTNIRELEPGVATDLGDGLSVTVFGSAEYTNDSAILVEAEGFSVFNETDCKLSYDDYLRVRDKGIDIGFYMFSGANWYPIKYDYPDETMLKLVARRRATLVSGFVRRVKATRPRFAVPSAGPCSVLDPDLLWMNSTERGIFIDPKLAVAALRQASTGVEGLCMAASDRWDPVHGFEPRAPEAFRGDRAAYLRNASDRMAATIRGWKAAEAPSGSDLSPRVVEYFETRVASQSPEIRRRIGAKLLIEATGKQAGAWTVDFNAAGGPFAREGRCDDFTYRMRTEDVCLYPFVSGHEEFLEDLFLTLRVSVARRPDVYNEPLYHFLYDPDPRRLQSWYAAH
jgi:UDP-MurNAc hydroxylase